MKKVLITFAVKEEIIPINIKNCEVIELHTGVGKARSAMMLTEAILKHTPDIVINIGSSGSVKHNIGSICVCDRFVDRDYHSVQLPGIDFEISSKALIKKDKELAKWIERSSTLSTCNTGDSFVTEISEIEGDVIDMEGFAQALVCSRFETPFVSIKYVTDIIGQNSVKHWEDKLEDARRELSIWVKENLQSL